MRRQLLANNPAMSAPPASISFLGGPQDLKSMSTYERTNLSLLSQSGFLGLKVINLLNRTWAAGARPIGAPGWPELALKVASTCLIKISIHEV